MEWIVLDADEVARLDERDRMEMEALEKRAPNRHQPHCLCGRFAKWVSDQHYYNGTFDCYRYTVRCSRCGDVDIECV